MIVIGKPKIVYTKTKSRLQSMIVIDKQPRLIWFETDKKYAGFLCSERADAFLVGLLNYAMRNNHDISCEAPVGEELYYQITNYLIDALFNGSKNLHRTKVFAEVDTSRMASAGAVGTGVSCGVDFFYTISNHTNSIFSNHNVTHLAFNNVGSHGTGDVGARLFAERGKIARKFAEEYGFELVEGNSNIHDQIHQNHFLTHTYTSSFAVLCLQKLYSVYLYSSSHPFKGFSLVDNEMHGSHFYDLLSLSMFSTSTVNILSEGGTKSRLDKMKKIVFFKPSYDYLNVCIRSANNCGVCEKCSRTLLALDVLGKLDNYKSVFDIEFYKKHKQDYLVNMVLGRLINRKKVKGGPEAYKELYPILKPQISFRSKVKGFAKYVRYWLASTTPGGLKKIINKLKPKVCVH